MIQEHCIPPVYDKNSKILILGSFPSVKSREQKFFYGHPQNRFWKILADIFKCETPQTVPEKKKLLLDNGIAVWDVIKSCDIEGSADSRISHAVPNDLSIILDFCRIEKIFVNGKTAQKLFDRLIKPRIYREAVYLPSSSPANAAWSSEKLSLAWKEKLIDNFSIQPTEHQ